MAVTPGNEIGKDEKKFWKGTLIGKQVQATELDYYTVQALQTAVLTAKKVQSDPKSSEGLKGKMLTIANKCQSKQLKITKFYNDEYKKPNHGLVNGKKLLQMRMVDVYKFQGKDVVAPEKDGMGGMTAAAWIADNKNTIIGISIAAMGVAGVDMILNKTIGKNVVSGLCSLFMKMWGASPAGAVIMTAGGVCALSTLLAKHFHSQSMKNKITASRLKEAKVDIAMSAQGAEKDENGNYVEPTQSKKQQMATEELYQQLMDGVLKVDDINTKLADVNTSPAEASALKAALTKFVKEEQINANIQAFHNAVELDANKYLEGLMDGSMTVADLDMMIGTPGKPARGGSAAVPAVAGKVPERTASGNIKKDKSGNIIYRESTQQEIAAAIKAKALLAQFKEEQKQAPQTKS